MLELNCTILLIFFLCVFPLYYSSCFPVFIIWVPPPHFLWVILIFFRIPFDTSVMFLSIYLNFLYVLYYVYITYHRLLPAF